MKNNHDLIAHAMKNFVGIGDMMTRYHSLVGEQQPTYPPYNLCKTPTGDYQLEIAVAGFSQAELDVELEDQLLTVKGSKSEIKDDNYRYYHKGIASRNFTLKFLIPENSKIESAKLADGMLSILVHQVIPEDKKPKKIPFVADTKLIEM